MNNKTSFSLLLLLFGCMLRSGATVPMPPPCLNISAQLTPESCPGNGDGAIDIAISGGQSPYTFLWSTGDAIEDLQGLTSGIYTVTVTDSLGCEVSDTFSVGVLGPSPEAHAGRDTILCSDQYQMIAQTPMAGSGNWQVVSGSAQFADSANPQTQVNGFSPGSNLMAWVLSQGACADADTIEIYLSYAAAVDAGPDDSFCTSSYSLSGSSFGSGSGMWSGSSQFTFTNPNSPQSLVQNLSTGPNQVVWTVTEAGCTASDTAFLTGIPGVTAGFSSNQSNLEVTFTDQSQGAMGYFWDFGDGNTSTQASPTHTYAQPGSYLVCQQALDSCKNDTACQSITLACGNPTADFSYIPNGLMVDFTDLSSSFAGIAKWHWDFGDGDTSNLQNPSHFYLFPGNFWACLEVEDACGQNEACGFVELGIVGTAAAQAEAVQLWPSLADERIHIRLSGYASQSLDIALRDLKGRAIRQMKQDIDADPFEFSIELGELTAGMYLLELRGPTSRRILRFIKN